MDVQHEDQPEHPLTDEEMIRLEHMRGYLRYRGEFIGPDHDAPIAVTIIRDDAP